MKIRKKILIAVRNFILFSAIVHVALLFTVSLFKLDISHLNYFNILDLNLIFPKIEKGYLSQILSIGTVIITFLGIYWLSLRRPAKSKMVD